VPRSKNIAAKGDPSGELRFATAANLMATLVAQFGSNCQVSLYETRDGVAQLRSSAGTVMDVPQGSRLSAALLDKFRQATSNRASRMQFMGATPDGRRLSSSITALTDTSTGEEIGLLKIDFCIEHLISSIDVLQTYCGIEEPRRPEAPSGDDDIGRMVDGIIAEAFTSGSGLSGKEYRIDIVRRLEDKDIFRVKGAVDIVSGRLNVSKYSVYNYIDQVRRGRLSK
jgi:predicted transcriptional regulator YheO